MNEGELELTPVYVTYGHLTAEVMRAKLEAAGIPAILQYESAGLVLGLTVDGLGQVQVLTPARYAEAARILLQESAEPFDADADGDTEPPQ